MHTYTLWYEFIANVVDNLMLCNTLPLVYNNLRTQIQNTHKGIRPITAMVRSMDIEIVSDHKPLAIRISCSFPNGVALHAYKSHNTSPWNYA